jgi:hypothetical protein
VSEVSDEVSDENSWVIRRLEVESSVISGDDAVTCSVGVISGVIGGSSIKAFWSCFLIADSCDLESGGGGDMRARSKIESIGGVECLAGLRGDWRPVGGERGENSRGRGDVSIRGGLSSGRGSVVRIDEIELSERARGRGMSGVLTMLRWGSSKRRVESRCMRPSGGSLLELIARMLANTSFLLDLYTLRSLAPFLDFSFVLTLFCFLQRELAIFAN